MQSAKRLAGGLSNLGLRPQDRVVVQLPNGPEFVILYLALNYIGVIPVMALRAHRHAEIRHFVRSSGAVGLLHSPIASARSTTGHGRRDCWASFPSLAHVIVAGEPGPGQMAFAPLAWSDRRR